MAPASRRRSRSRPRGRRRERPPLPASGRSGRRGISSPSAGRGRRRARAAAGRAAWRRCCRSPRSRPGLRGRDRIAGRSATCSSGFDGDSSQSRSALHRGLAPAVRVVGGESRERSSALAAGPRGQADDGLVAVIREHDLGARGQQVEDRRGRSHAGGERDGGAVLETAEDLLERLPGRCPVVARIGAVAAEDEVRGQYRRHVERAARGLDRRDPRPLPTFLARLSSRAS